MPAKLGQSDMSLGAAFLKIAFAFLVLNFFFIQPPLWISSSFSCAAISIFYLKLSSFFVGVNN
jgi:hypothetical protein